MKQVFKKLYFLFFGLCLSIICLQAMEEEPALLTQDFCCCSRERFQDEGDLQDFICFIGKLGLCNPVKVFDRNAILSVLLNIKTQALLTFFFVLMSQFDNEEVEVLLEGDFFQIDNKLMVNSNLKRRYSYLLHSTSDRPLVSAFYNLNTISFLIETVFVNDRNACCDVGYYLNCSLYCLLSTVYILSLCSFPVLTREESDRVAYLQSLNDRNYFSKDSRGIPICNILMRNSGFLKKLVHSLLCINAKLLGQVIPIVKNFYPYLHKYSYEKENLERERLLRQQLSFWRNYPCSEFYPRWKALFFNNLVKYFNMDWLMILDFSLKGVRNVSTYEIYKRCLYNVSANFRQKFALNFFY